MRKIILTLAAGAAVPLLGLAPAMAASSHPRPTTNTPTAACQVTNPACAEPVEAQSPLAVDNYSPIDDAALSYNGASQPVTINPNNNAQDGSQDWVWQEEGTVPSSGPGAFNFTGFDNANYAGDGVYEIEWTPNGVDSDLCAHVTWTETVVLRSCNGGGHQAFIVTPGALPLVPAPGASGYVYAMNADQAKGSTAQHHYCLTGTPGAIAGAVTVSRCKSAGHATGTDQQWGALP